MSKRGPGRVRIVAGAERGRWIRVPAQAGVRPTSAKVREAIFDVLGPVDGLDVIDLFAGSGSLGLEALSRGAKSCLFVEADAEVATILRGNITALSYEDISRVMVKDYQRAVNALREEERRCDLLFIDPPYRMLAEVEAEVEPVVQGIVAAEGLVVIEGPRLAEVTFGQDPVFERQYGDTRITMVRLKG